MADNVVVARGVRFDEYDADLDVRGDIGHSLADAEFRRRGQSFVKPNVAKSRFRYGTLVDNSQGLTIGPASSDYDFGEMRRNLREFAPQRFGSGGRQDVFDMDNTQLRNTYSNLLRYAKKQIGE